MFSPQANPFVKPFFLGPHFHLKGPSEKNSPPELQSLGWSMWVLRGRFPLEIFWKDLKDLPSKIFTRPLWCTPPPSHSHHQDYYMFTKGTLINLHLWLQSWVGGVDPNALKRLAGQERPSTSSIFWGEVVVRRSIWRLKRAKNPGTHERRKLGQNMLRWKKSKEGEDSGDVGGTWVVRLMV